MNRNPLKWNRYTAARVRCSLALELVIEAVLLGALPVAFFTAGGWGLL